jgi:hypothetical protein
MNKIFPMSKDKTSAIGKKGQKKMWKKCANKTCKETNKQNVLRDTQQIEHD